MIPARLLRRAVTIVRPGETTDRYGTTTYTWDNAQRTTVLGELQPRTAGENLSGRTLETTDCVLYVQPSVDLRADDRIEVDGESYFVVGPPLSVYRLGVPHHLLANVKVAEG